MSTIVTRAAAAALAAAALAATASSVPAQAFTAENSLSVSGVRYYAKAWSCNAYLTACSWDSTATISTSKSYTHKADVKANGFSLTINISKGGGVTVSGNSTSLTTASRSSYGTYSYMAGVAHPSIFSVSVAARTRLYAGGQSLSTGWTTW